MGVVPSAPPVVSHYCSNIGGDGVSPGFGVEVNDANVFEFWELVKSCIEVVDVGL